MHFENKQHSCVVAEQKAMHSMQNPSAHFLVDGLALAPWLLDLHCWYQILRLAPPPIA